MKKNVAHAIASFYLIMDTDLDVDTFKNKFNGETIVGSKVIFCLPDGVGLHSASFASLEDFKVVDFEQEEKATKLQTWRPNDQV
jgi:hypothetical protein